MTGGERNLFDVPCSDNGFNRYMAVSPEGKAIWESEFSAGISESEAWEYFLDWCSEGEHDGIPDFGRARDECGDDELYEDKMRQYGWRIVEVRPILCDFKWILNAAPDLLEACEELVRFEDRPYSDQFDIAIQHAKAAVKKAEGKGQ